MANGERGLGAGPLTQGTRLQGRYEIQRVLGFGGVSTVYLAIDRRFQATERRCAVKEMVDAVVDPAIREISLHNFEREANVLASLNHIAVPKIYDYFQQGGRLYLVEELIEGEDLALVQAKTRGPIQPELAIGWALQIMEVLEYLHGQQPDPIIFRDLKPSNIMLAKNNRIVMIDFGIAKTFTGLGKGTMIGTDGYAAPEQYRGVADPRTDIYGLGATLHHLLTASDPREHPPFSWRERPIHSLNVGVPHAVSEVVGRALEYQPDARFQSIDEFRRALRAASNGYASGGPVPDLGGHLPTAPSPSRAPSVRLQATRGLPTTTGGLLARLPHSGLLTPVADAPAEPEPVVEVEVEVDDTATGPVELVWRRKVGDEIRGTAAAGADQIFVGSYDNYLYCLKPATGDMLWRYQTNAGICATPVIWGGHVHFGSEDGHFYAINARTGALAWSYTTEAPVRSSAAMGDNVVVFGADNGIVYALEARTGRELWQTQTWDRVRATPYLHDRFVLVGSYDRTFYCLEIESGRTKWKYEAGNGIVSSPAVHENTVYFGVLDGSVTALDIKSGWMSWRHRTDGQVVSSPVVANGRVFVGSVDKKLWALDAQSGRVAWSFATEGQVNASPRVADERIYVASIDGRVYCVDKAGKLVWKFRTGGPVPASPLLCDGLVVIGSCDHHCYALRG